LFKTFAFTAALSTSFTYAPTFAPGRSTGSGACGFGAKSRAGMGGRYATANLRAPLAPKPGPLTQSPCLEAVGAERFNAKTGCKPRRISADSYKNVYQCSFDTRLMACSARSPVKLNKLDKSLCDTDSPAVPGVLLPTQHRQGVVIGSGDRALGCKARVPGFLRTVEPAPRVIAPQNRMHLTRSPRRSKRQPGRTKEKDPRKPTESRRQKCGLSNHNTSNPTPQKPGEAFFTRG